MSRIREALDTIKLIKESNDGRGAIIAVSADKSSKVLLTLAKIVFGDNIAAVILPNGEQRDIQKSIDIAKEAKVPYRIVNIGEAVSQAILSIERRIDVVDGYYDYTTNLPELSCDGICSLVSDVREAVMKAVCLSIPFVYVKQEDIFDEEKKVDELYFELFGDSSN